MKKITGKVVALVLALALVVTSFSSSFAFASTTKTMSGQVTGTDHDKIYLVNGGLSKEVDLTTFLVNSGKLTLATKDRSDVSSPKIDAISHVSGDNLVSLYIQSTGSKDAILKLKNSSSDGHEVISILYEGSYTNDNGDEYTVKAKKNFDVYVYDKDAIVYGEEFTGTKDSGTGLDDFETFAQTAYSNKTLGIYKAEPYDAGANSSALAIYSIPSIAMKDSGFANSTDYSLSITGNGVNTGFDDHQLKTTLQSAVVGINVPATTTTPVIAAHLKDAGTSNITITIKKLVPDTSVGAVGTFKASTDSAKKYVLKTKIEKKVDAEYAVGSALTYNITKDNGNTMLTTPGSATSAKVTDCEVVFPSTTTQVTVDKDTHVKKISGYVGHLDIGNASVGSVNVKSGDVYVSDGKVGDITTDDKVGTGTVTVNSGKTGNIKTTDADGASGDNGNVTVTGGTTGTIESNGLVSVTSNEDDTTIITGKITAPKALAYSDAGKITIAGFKANDKDGYLTLKGDNTNVASIDFDYYTGTTLNLGLDDDTFTGKIPAPLNASNTKIAVNTEDTVATVNGAVTADTISVDTNATVSFDSAVTVKTVDGDGSMKIAAGKLYVSDSASGVKLKLTDANLAIGTVVFKAKTDTVDEDSLTTYGYTLAKSTGTEVDTFKIATLSFAGVAINKTSSNIAKNYSETFTASAYPGGTAIPTGDTIKWDLDGGSSDVFTLTSTGNTATVKVNSIDSTFASENKTTLTATLYDADGYVIDDFDAAKCELTATAVPDAKSDTNSAVSVAKGASYQMKVTSATLPTVTTGTNGVFSVVVASKNGNDYFYKLTATGAVNASTGIFLNGTKIFVATVKAFAFTSDTTGTATVKGAYQFKITSATTPTVGLGSTGVFKVAFVSKTGTAYLYKLTSVGAAGAKAGIYVNGAKAFVAVVG